MCVCWWWWWLSLNFLFFFGTFYDKSESYTINIFISKIESIFWRYTISLNEHPGSYIFISLRKSIYPNTLSEFWNKLFVLFFFVVVGKFDSMKLNPFHLHRIRYEERLVQIIMPIIPCWYIWLIWLKRMWILGL